jgi:hypothetical protein
VEIAIYMKSVPKFRAWLRRAVIAAAVIIVIITTPIAASRDKQ